MDVTKAWFIAGVRSSALLRLALTLAAMLPLAVACGDPCVDLSKKICRCEKSDALQQACLQNVDDQAGTLEASDAENERCSELLDTCTCAKLADGKLEACGLTEPEGG